MKRPKSHRLPLLFAPTGAHIFAADYFAEEVRREMLEKYGEKKLYDGGLSVRATLDPKLQVAARKALVDGLTRYDESQGWRGPVQKIDISADWGVALAEVRALMILIGSLRLLFSMQVQKQRGLVFNHSREPGGAVTVSGVLVFDH